MKHGHGAKNTQYVQPANLKGKLHWRMSSGFKVIWSVELPLFIWLLEIGHPLCGCVPRRVT